MTSVCIGTRAMPSDRYAIVQPVFVRLSLSGGVLLPARGREEPPRAVAFRAANAKRERDFYLSRVDRAKAIAAMEARRGAKAEDGKENRARDVPARLHSATRSRWLSTGPQWGRHLSRARCSSSPCDLYRPRSSSSCPCSWVQELSAVKKGACCVRANTARLWCSRRVSHRNRSAARALPPLLPAPRELRAPARTSAAAAAAIAAGAAS